MRHHQMDSLLFYQAQLVVQMPHQQAQLNRRLLDYVVGNPRLSTTQQAQYIQQYAPEGIWHQAYYAHWFQLQNQPDSAEYYWGLLEDLPDTTAPKRYVANCWALLFAQRGHFGKAGTYLEQANQEPLPPLTEQAFYVRQIQTYRLMGKGVRAAALAQTYLAFLEQATVLDSVAIAYAYDALTRIYLMQERYYQATFTAGEALNYMADRQGHAYELGSFWYHWSQAHAALQHAASATLLYLQRAEELLRQATDHAQQKEALIEVYNLMASEWIRQPQLDSAVHYLQRVEELQRETPHQRLLTQETRAQYYEVAEQPNRAEQALQKALKWTQQQENTISWRTAERYLALGRFYKRQQRYAQAEQSLRQAYLAQYLGTTSQREIRPTSTQVISLPLALTIGMERMEVMLVLYKESRYALSASAITTQLQLNATLLKEWEGHYARWSPGWSEIVQRLGQQVMDWYWEGEQAGIRTLPADKAFYWAEQVRQTRFLTDLLGQDQCFPGMDTSWVDTWQQHSRETDHYYRAAGVAMVEKEDASKEWVQQALHESTEQYMRTLTTVHQKHPRYLQWYHLKHSTPSLAIDLNAIKDQLRQDNAALLQYLETDKVLYQWIVTADTLLLRRVVWEDYRSTLLKYERHFTNPRLRQNAHSGGFQDYCRTAHELYYRLVHHEVLREQRRWVVVPDGLLQMLPFETLLTDIPLDGIHEVKYQQLAYVLQQHQISYHHSHQHWWETQTDSAQSLNQSMLAMATSYGQPVTSGSERYRTWRQLVLQQGFALPLIDSLNERFAGDFYTNRYATEHLLKEQSPVHGILHWGLYALASPQAQGGAGLLLMPDRYREDHLLQLHELYNLSLNADVLVLTNWWTDQSTQQIRQAWTRWAGGTYYAGSRALVMPLWLQDSSSTVVLNYYYKHLQEGMPKDEALRQAKLDYLQQSQGIEAHPARWAGYVALGNYQPVEIAAPVAYSWWFVIPIALVTFLGWWSLRALRQRR